MNKTRKNKYLRKNRRISKKNKNKNKKTRKVQRGGEDGDTAVDTGRNLLALGTGAPITQNQPTLSSLTVKGENVQPLKTLTREELIEKEQAFIKQQRAFRTKQIAAAKEEAEATAAAAAAAAVTEKKAAAAAKEEAEATAAAAAEKAAGSRNIAEAAKEDEEQAAEAAAAAAAAEAAHFGQFGQSGRPYNNMRDEFVGPMNDTATSTPPAADHAPADVTNESPPASTEIVYDPKMSPPEKIAYFTQNALKRNELRQRPDRRITLLANSIPNAILGKLGSIGSDSQKKLADGEVLTEFIGDLSEIIKDSEDRVAIIREYNRLLTKEITDIYTETQANGGILTEERIEHLHDLLGHLTKNDEDIKRLRIEPAQLLHAMQTGNIAALESQFGTQSQFGSQSRMLGNDSSKPGKRNPFSNLFSKDVKSPAPRTPPGTAPGTAENISKNPSFINRMVKKISGSFRKKELTPEEAAKQQHREEQKALDKANRFKRDKSGLIPAGVKTKFSNMGQAVKTGVSNMGQAVKTGVSNMGKTVKTGVSNMGKTVKTGVSNMGQAVKTGFNSARQKFSKKNPANDSERLLSNSGRSNDTANTEQKKSWRERLVNMKQSASEKFGSLKKTATNAKDAAVARFTRKNRGNENPESKKTRLLSDNEEIEMQNIEPTPLPSQPTTPAEAAAPATQPDDDDNKISFKNFNIKPKATTTETAPVPTSVPTSVPNLSPPPPAQPRTRSRPQDGGNKTRKNRQHQYIHEVKDNRTHLFNKEMEILNSIRNFKNGHIDNDNTKKQFMKAVKRG